MAYSLDNRHAKNCCKWIIFVQLIVEDVVTCFFGTQCTYGVELQCNDTLHCITTTRKSLNYSTSLVYFMIPLLELILHDI